MARPLASARRPAKRGKGVEVVGAVHGRGLSARAATASRAAPESSSSSAVEGRARARPVPRARGRAGDEDRSTRSPPHGRSRTRHRGPRPPARWPQRTRPSPKTLSRQGSFDRPSACIEIPYAHMEALSPSIRSVGAVGDPGGRHHGVERLGLQQPDAVDLAAPQDQAGDLAKTLGRNPKPALRPEQPAMGPGT